MAEERLDSVVRQALSLPPEQRPAFLAEQLGEDLETRALALVKLRELEEVTLPVDLEQGNATAGQRGNDGQNTTRVAAWEEPAQVAAALSARLSPAELTRLQDLFERACELDPELRSAFITAHCDEQPQLAEELLALLDSDVSLRDLTVRPIDPIKALAQPHNPFYDRPGAQLGRYSLVRQLGKGGMGTVWLAQRADGQFQRTVALKLISAGQESDAIQARFLRERQILASLSHPNIAKLLDGGVAPDGRPYFVMEYVDGEPITSYCDERHFTVVERLRLFLQVCRAVQHAHQRLIVHRDLKPSNILVTPERMVQLLDFGIAKLLHPDLMGLTDLTRAEDQAMTPRYAAPEQIRNETITTATDIYALGVLLYELLTGRMPYNVRGSAGHALEQAILDSEPRRPSLSLTDPAESDCESLAALRGAHIPQLRQAIAGDLETVVLQALKKHPAERYPSVEAFAKDLEHYLDGRPISARPDTVGYRVGKFISRHRAGVALVSLSFLGLLLALVVSISQAQRAQEAADRAAAVDSFLIGLFEEIDPESGDAASLRARDLLDLGAAKVDSELAADPVLKSSLNALLGRLLLATGDPDRASERLQLARNSALLPAEERGRTAIDYARALIASQRFEEAHAVLLARQKEVQSDPIGLAQVLTSRADLESELGRYDQAKDLAEQALKLWQQAPAEQHASRAKTLMTLAKIDDLRDQSQSAEEHANAAKRLLHERYGDHHLDIARVLQRIANLQRRRGDIATARDTLGKALAMATELVGRDHMITLDMRRMDADLLDELGEYGLAEEALKEIISDTERRYGRFHLLRATALNSMVAIAFRRQDLAAAEPHMREIVDIYRGIYGDRHNEVATVLNNLANVLREQGRLTEARRLLDEVLSIREQTVGTEHNDYAYTLLGVARVAQLNGEPLASANAFARAADIFAQAQGDPSVIRSTRVRRVHALLDHGDLELAERELATLGEAPQAADNPAENARQIVESWARARLSQADGDHAAAREQFAQIVPLAEQAWPITDTRRIGILVDAAVAFRASGDAPKASDWLQQAAAAKPRVLEPRIRQLLAEQ